MAGLALAGLAVGCGKRGELELPEEPKPAQASQPAQTPQSPQAAQKP